MGKQLCIYCGCGGELTRDHVPPRGLFPKPRPDDLITVPCCKACNASFAKDDEHFRTIIACNETTASHPESVRLWDTKVLRQLQHSGGSAIPELLRQIFGTPSEVTAVELHAATLRVARMVTRIVKGLHFVEMQTIFPNDWEVGMNLEPSFETCGGLAGVRSVFESATVSSDRKIGNGVFRYQMAKWPNKEFGVVWLLTFFESLTFLCTSGPAEAETTKSIN